MKKQRGFTLISVVLILALIAFFSLLAMRLLPMYQEYYAVLQVMDGMETELKNNKLTKQQVLTLLKKRFNIGYIKVVDLKEDVVIERGKNNVRVTRIIINYEDRVPFIAQLSLVGNFHAEVDIEPKGK
jgi:Tfp pilus assembly major pilin PilA